MKRKFNMGLLAKCFKIAVFMFCIACFIANCTIPPEPISEDRIYGEYIGRCSSPYNMPNLPIGSHRIILKSDHAYSYEYKHPNKELFSFSGTWRNLSDGSNQIVLEDFYYRISPFDYGFHDHEKDARGGVTLLVYPAKNNTVTLDICEAMELKRVDSSLTVTD